MNRVDKKGYEEYNLNYKFQKKLPTSRQILAPCGEKNKTGKPVLQLEELREAKSSHLIKMITR